MNGLIRLLWLSAALLVGACADPPQGPGAIGSSKDSGAQTEDSQQANDIEFGSSDSIVSDIVVGDVAAGDVAAGDAVADAAPQDVNTADAGADAADGTPATDATQAADAADAVADAGLVDTTDTTVVDTSVLDAPSTDGGQTDAPLTDSDPDANSVDPCGTHEFAYKAPAGAKSVVVTGDWLGWNAVKGAAMTDSAGDGTWTAKVVLGPGKWLYKFVVDGKWQADPNNPDKADDGFGAFNSVLTLPACSPPIVASAIQVDHEKGTLSAMFKASAGALELGNVAVTIDGKADATGCIAMPGGGCTISVKAAADGIHDVRVFYGGHVVMLKLYKARSTDWRDDAIYFAMTDRFANGDKTNDKPIAGTPAPLDWQGGDFVGLTGQINAGYFDKLGASALWISWPAKQFDGAEPGGQIDQTGCGIDPKNANYKATQYTAYHGYWPASTNKVEPHFGTMPELRTMVNAAHARGIRVLLDFTANHVHTSADLYKNNNDIGWFHMPAEVCGDIGWEKKPVSCWFTKYLADFNYSNPATRKAMIDAAVWWAKESGADGLRLDAVKHIEMAFIEELRAAIGVELELTGVDFYVVGETFTGDAGAIATFVGDKRIHAQFDFPTNMQILKTFAKYETSLGDADKTVRGIKAVYGSHSPWMSTFIGNHDIARFISHAGGDLPCGVWDMVSNQAAGWKSPPAQPTSLAPYSKTLLAFVYAFTVPGIPLIYHGDEFGMAGAGDPDNRRMMRFDGDVSANEKALLQRVRALGKLRQELAPLRRGSWSEPLLAGFDVLLFARVHAGQAAVVAINRGGTASGGSFDTAKLGLASKPSVCAYWDLSGANNSKQNCAIGADGKVAYKLDPLAAQVLLIQ